MRRFPELLEAAERLHASHVDMRREVRERLRGLGWSPCPVCSRMVPDVAAHAMAAGDPEHAVLAVTAG